MKAAVFIDVNKIVYREDYPKPSPGPDDVIVKTHYCGICGSDITNFKLKMYQVPLIMGHEFTGEVIEIGSNITDIKQGDKVCGINVALDLDQGQLEGMGIFMDGGFAEFVKVPRKFLFQIPKSVSTKEAVMIESFANACRAIKLSNITGNQNIIIIGAGNIGLCFLSYLLIEKKPNYLIVIEPEAFLREKAMEFGATESFPPNPAKIKKFIKRNGKPTYIFDCAGNQKSILMAIDLIKKGGAVILEGVFKGKVSFPMFLLNSKEVSIKGVLGHDREDILCAIDFFSQGKINADKYISQIIPIQDIQKAFERFIDPGEREFIKLVVKL
ncbi:MAG: alcohol dehydrogenase catalytic domain-containing protein [Candidatus Lokiarchaeota archaeon]|nr:alcohol dehydrogenase catalytic domain-containing protein [Candidatus Lokiarchaeota archaeon]